LRATTTKPQLGKQGQQNTRIRRAERKHCAMRVRQYCTVHPAIPSAIPTPPGLPTGVAPEQKRSFSLACWCTTRNINKMQDPHGVQFAAPGDIRDTDPTASRRTRDGVGCLTWRSTSRAFLRRHHQGYFRLVSRKSDCLRSYSSALFSRTPDC
jgi:hypothetical protein